MNNQYKVYIDMITAKNIWSRNDMTLEEFMKIWYELEPAMAVVEKEDNIENKKDIYDC